VRVKPETIGIAAVTHNHYIARPMLFE